MFPYLFRDPVFWAIVAWGVIVVLACVVMAFPLSF